MSELQKVVTPDDLMEEFISDSVVADDELSDSIFTCVDNFIDDLCIKVMNDENSILDDNSDVDTPFTYILDKVMEKVDTIDKIQLDAYGNVLEKQLSDKIDKETNNVDDPDYCEGVDLDDITPEDFQLYVAGNINDEESYDDGYGYRANNPEFFDDSNFNA